MKALVVVALLAVPVAAKAQVYAVNVGVIEIIGLPVQHVGLYPYAGLSAAFTSKGWSLVPSLAVEFSPELGRWGGVATLTLDYNVTGFMGVDLNLTLIHDQAGTDFANALYFAGAGPGLTFYFQRWTVSLYASAFHGLNTPGWSVVPGINLAYALSGVD